MDAGMNAGMNADMNAYVPFLSEIKKVIRHTEIEYTFRM